MHGTVPIEFFKSCKVPWEWQCVYEISEMDNAEIQGKKQCSRCNILQEIIRE